MCFCTLILGDMLRYFLIIFNSDMPIIISLKSGPKQLFYLYSVTLVISSVSVCILHNLGMEQLTNEIKSI